MGLHYGLPQPLRLYENKAHRNKLIPGGQNQVFKLLCPLDKLLPFQIKRASSSQGITSIKLMYDDLETEALDLLPDMDANDFDVFVFESYDYLLHYGYLEHTATIQPGRYYLEISDSENTWWSETITFEDFDSEALDSCVPTRIEFTDTCDVGSLFFRPQKFGGQPFRFLIYLDVDIGRPTHATREEGEENALGETTTTYAVSEKQHLLQTPLPQYMLDCLALIPLHFVTGEVKVATWRGYESKIIKFTMESEWQGSKAAFALTDITLVTDVITKTSCCGDLDSIISRCIVNSASFVAEVLEDSADYTNFEYTDLETSNKIPFEDGDLVLVESLAGLKNIYTYASSAYSAVIPPAFSGGGIYDLNKLNGNALSGFDLFFDAVVGGYVDTPVINYLGEDLSSGQYKVQGLTWASASIEVWVNTGSGAVLAASGSGSTFIDTGILFDIPNGAQDVYVKARSLKCLNLGVSASENFEGIGFISIGSTLIN